MKKFLPVFAMALLAAACAGGPRRVSHEEVLAQYLDYAGEPVNGFMSVRLQSWQPLTRNQLILWTGINEAYLVTVWDSCPDLLFANSIGVTTTGSQVSTFDHLKVGRDRCQIKEIRPVNVRQMKSDRAADAASRSGT